MSFLTAYAFIYVAVEQFIEGHPNVLPSEGIPDQESMNVWARLYWWYMVRLADVWLGFGFLAHMLVDYIKSLVPFLHLIGESSVPQYRMLDSSDIYKWD